mgnify:CR=1 FL=1
MNKKKKIVQELLTVGVIIVGIYMLVSFTWGTPPTISGLGFLMAGLALWVPHCPVIHKLLGDKQ